MNRVLPVIFVAVGVCLHFTYCEWELSNDRAPAVASQSDRVIFYRYQDGFTRRRMLPVRQVTLLAKSSHDKQDATTYGVALPGLLIGGALLVWRFQST